MREMENTCTLTDRTFGKKEAINKTSVNGKIILNGYLEK
jgi:hypothetical protein